MEPDWTEDPDLELAARRFRIEREEDQSELEEMEEETRDRVLDLPFALLELQWRGDRVRVLTPERTFEGVVVHVGDDLLTVQTGPDVYVDFRTERVGGIAVVERSRASGRSKLSRDPRRFVARLREVVDSIHVRCELGAGPGVHLSGTVERVHADHLAFRAVDRSEWLVPLHAIAYLIRNERRETRR